MLDPSYAGPTLEDNWADFGSDSLPTIMGVFPILLLRTESAQIILSCEGLGLQI